MSRESLMDELLRKLAVLPKPILADQAVECARMVLPGKELTEFEAWFKANGASLLQRINA